ncbi:MAG: ATP-dependent DNA helicase RecG, partial [Anaerolineales bacterium]|nr:ATP-dependent DNA helicase RecG [Anaerolineales bacterium]
MQRSFKRLERVLELEAKQGYQNKAVVGGIRQFVTYWVAQAREQAADEADKAFVEQTADVLMDYGRLPGTEARARAVQSLITGLRRRQERVVEQAPPPPAAEPPAPPAAAETKAEVETEVDAAVDGETAVAPEELAAAPPPADPTAAPDPDGLSQSVVTLKGVGAKIGKRFGKLGVETLWELLYLFPRRYDDYTLMKPIKDLAYGDQVTVIGTVWEIRARRTRTNQPLVQAVISDGTATIQATWFNQPWLVDKLKSGMQIVLSGKVDQYLGRPVMPSPEWEELEIEPLRTRRIVPVYPLTEGLNSNKMRDLMFQAVSRWAARVPDPLPRDVRQRQQLYSLPQALQHVHFPDNHGALHQARRRLIFDELFLLQLGMQRKRREWQAAPGIPLHAPDALAPFLAQLPFSLTGAQERVIAELVADLGRGVPMNRLLQGDVGAGKTIVAAAAMLVTVRAGAQAALMAPTEILAEQHFRGLSQQLEPLGVRMALLTGSVPTAAKAEIYAGLASGEIQVAIGTHALIQEAVTFHKLGLAVIDEQHRFGVDQRGALRQKGVETTDGQPNPHLLVMSATPIPRSLALSLYGDLDVSILDEMPPGRQEIKTRWLRSSERERAYAFLRRQIKE